MNAPSATGHRPGPRWLRLLARLNGDDLEPQHPTTEEP